VIRANKSQPAAGRKSRETSGGADICRRGEEGYPKKTPSAATQSTSPSLATNKQLEGCGRQAVINGPPAVTTKLEFEGAS